MGVNNPDCAPIIVESQDPGYAKSNFNDLINDNLPNLSFERCSCPCSSLETHANDNQHHDDQDNDPSNQHFQASSALPDYYYPAALIRLPTPVLFRL